MPPRRTTRQVGIQTLLHPVAPVADQATNQAFEGFRREVQQVLQLLGERVDTLQGLRGSPEFFTDVEMTGNRIRRMGNAVDDDDAQNRGGALSKSLDGLTFDARGLQVVNLALAKTRGEAVPFEQLEGRLTELLRTATDAIAAALVTFLTVAHTWTALQTFTAGINLGQTTLSTYNDAGTFTITGTGFTANPTPTARYIVIGKKVGLYIPQVSGTSNATTFTLTGLPAAIQPTLDSHHPVRITDNSVQALGLLRMNAGSTTIDLFSTVAAGAWTAANTKTLFPMLVSYALL